MKLGKLETIKKANSTKIATIVVNSLKLNIDTFFTTLLILGGGQNVDDQNVDGPKISERRNGLFS